LCRPSRTGNCGDLQGCLRGHGCHGKANGRVDFFGCEYAQTLWGEFLQIIESKPAVVFSTAYTEFAVEGFELDAVDYLLKPFSFERFVKAVNKVKEKGAANVPANHNGYILLKADKKIYRTPFEDILYFEALGDYVKVYLVDKVLIVTTTLKKLLEELPETQFIRTHKSFIVNKSKIEYLEGNQLKIKEQLIPIGQAYKEEVLKGLG
jgi:DNA-binding LytR/AlgR family response regulator